MTTTIGDTGAPSNNNIYYDALLSTTLMARRKNMVDNIFKDSAVLSYLRMTDAVKKQNGGERIAIPLMYGTNDTVKTVGDVEVKEKLAIAINTFLDPIRERRAEFDDEKKLTEILTEGTKKARSVAEETIGEVKDAMGVFRV